MHLIFQMKLQNMNKLIAIAIAIVFCAFIASCASNYKIAIENKHQIMSQVDSTYTPEVVLIQEVRISVPIEKVWVAYTTKQGWESWAVPMAEVNWKVGGLIRTRYDTKGKIGEAGTIVNHIVNYVPMRLITLQAELSPHFPEFMQKDAKDFYNVIVFNKIDDYHTKVESFGIGYKDTEEYHSLMKFFIPANEQSYINLINYLEKGQKVEFKSNE